MLKQNQKHCSVLYTSVNVYTVEIYLYCFNQPIVKRVKKFL